MGIFSVTEIVLVCRLLYILLEALIHEMLATTYIIAKFFFVKLCHYNDF